MEEGSRSKIEETLAFNRTFVENRCYKKFDTTKYPSKKLAILTCMDTRLTELLPAALNLQNGDVKMIKNAGAFISNPFGSVARSLVVSIYELGVEEIWVINHYDCGMQNINTGAIIEKMMGRGVQQKDMEMLHYIGIDINQWLKGFEDPIAAVRETVKTIQSHPLIPKDICVQGFLIHPESGKLDLVDPPGQPEHCG